MTFDFNYGNEKPALNLRVAFTMVTLATEHGTSGLAAFGFGLYALASFLFNLDEGYRAGTIGLRLMEKYKALELTAKMYGLYYAHVSIWYGPRPRQWRMSRASF